MGPLAKIQPESGRRHQLKARLDTAVYALDNTRPLGFPSQTYVVTAAEAHGPATEISPPTVMLLLMALPPLSLANRGKVYTNRTLHVNIAYLSEGCDFISLKK